MISLMDKQTVVGLTSSRLLVSRCQILTFLSLACLFPFHGAESLLQSSAPILLDHPSKLVALYE